MAEINASSIMRALYEGRRIKSENLRLVLSIPKDNLIIHKHVIGGEAVPYCKIDVFPDSLVEMVGDWEIVKTEENIKAIAEKFSLTRDKEFCFSIYFKSSRFTQSCEEAMRHSRILYCKEKDYVLPRLTIDEEELFIELIGQKHG